MDNYTKINIARLIRAFDLLQHIAILSTSTIRRRYNICLKLIKKVACIIYLVEPRYARSEKQPIGKIGLSADRYWDCNLRTTNKLSFGYCI